MAATTQIFILLNFVLYVDFVVLMSIHSPNSCGDIVEREHERIVNYSLCPSTIQTDFNRSRIPRKIVKITCANNTGTCKCPSGYHCVQLRNTIDVYYFQDSDKKIIKKEKIKAYEYDSGCMCAKLPTPPGTNPGSKTVT